MQAVAVKRQRECGSQNAIVNNDCSLRPIHRRREHWSIYRLPSFLLLVCLFIFDPGVFNSASFVVHRGGTPNRLRELLVALLRLPFLSNCMHGALTLKGPHGLWIMYFKTFSRRRPLAILSSGIRAHTHLSTSFGC